MATLANMEWREALAISESLGAFFGILGIGWLANGSIRFLPALIAALIVGIGLTLFRRFNERP